MSFCSAEAFASPQLSKEESEVFKSCEQSVIPTYLPQGNLLSCPHCLLCTVPAARNALPCTCLPEHSYSSPQTSLRCPFIMETSSPPLPLHRHHDSFLSSVSSTRGRAVWGQRLSHSCSGPQGALGMVPTHRCLSQVFPKAKCKNALVLCNIMSSSRTECPSYPFNDLEP